MTKSSHEAPDAMLRRMAALALNRSERTRDTVERIRWLARHNDLCNQAADAAAAGDD